MKKHETEREAVRLRWHNGTMTDMQSVRSARVLCNKSANLYKAALYVDEQVPKNVWDKYNKYLRLSMAETIFINRFKY